LAIARDRISCLVSAGDLDAAFDALETAMKRFPPSQDLLYLRARIYLGRGQTGLALADHDTIVDSNPGNANAWAARAALLASLGRPRSVAPRHPGGVHEIDVPLDPDRGVRPARLRVRSEAEARGGRRGAGGDGQGGEGGACRGRRARGAPGTSRSGGVPGVGG